MMWHLLWRMRVRCMFHIDSHRGERRTNRRFRCPARNGGSTRVSCWSRRRQRRFLMTTRAFSVCLQKETNLAAFLFLVSKHCQDGREITLGGLLLQLVQLVFRLNRRNRTCRDCECVQSKTTNNSDQCA